MLSAAWWGFVGGASLLLGAVLAVMVRVPRKVIGTVMAFGAGVLVSAVAFELTEEAYRDGGGTPAVIGLLAGSVVYFVGDWAVDRHGGHRRKSPVHGGIRADARSAPHTGSAEERPSQPAAPSSGSGSGSGGSAASAGGLALVLGALLDGIPESAAIGISLLGGQGVGVAMVAAVFLSNIPESLSATTGLKAAGRSTRWILGLWSGVVVASVLAAVAGHTLLGGASPETVAVIQTFAAGAILTMLADTMMPEATEHAGRVVGLFTVLGFVIAFFVSTLS
ncbi:ZIP family zinc transporter [Luteipulveratus sp. YIM 133132]|uniref:ZIP family metal transporter n=1 Tax=Luteipulveratus flavus TaxID=3031728 RepID=UPI0023B14DAF|nr:ZIP family zinc transporter [Luteipulveratus sp. YIM 133132]MDE9364441.1 ZIP family zinc transporter [Luteipulveratus sp. YIM 133132]